MMAQPVDQALRELPLESGGDAPGVSDRILYYLNRELSVVVRKLLNFTNASWGSTVNVTGSISVEAGDEFMRVDATNGNVVLTLLPSEEAINGVRLLTIKKLDSTANTVAWLTQGDDLVDDSTTDALTSQYELVRLKPGEGGYDIA